MFQFSLVPWKEFSRLAKQNPYVRLTDQMAVQQGFDDAENLRDRGDSYLVAFFSPPIDEVTAEYFSNLH